MTDRPYPRPDAPWIMRQTWSRLLFAHWPLPPDTLRALLPAGLPLDTFDGQGWLGIVPFRMSDVAPRAVPAVSWLSAFPELNVRTYVTLGGRPGVWFFSLDAGNSAAVRIARSLFRLPYFDARMSSTRQAELDPANERGFIIEYTTRRAHRGASPAAFRATYGPTGPVAYAPPGSLAEWLTARYCLYTTGRHGQILRAEIDHLPWPLQPARAEILRNTMAAAAGIALPSMKPLLHYVESIDVHIWPVRAVRSPAAS